MSETRIDSTVAHDSFRESSRAYRGWIFAFILVLTLRIWFAFLGAAAVLTIESAKLVEVSKLYWGLTPSPMQGTWLLLTPWERWDAIWYLRIATFGYSLDDPSASFFPLFPILMRALGSFLSENYLLAGVVVCTIATFISFGLLYRMTADWADEPTAGRAVWYWAIFPTSFYLFGGYAESVLAACVIASLYFAQRRNWWLAGIAAAGATIARPIGLLVLIPLAIIAVRQAGSFRERVLGLFLSFAGVAMGFGGWMIYLHLTFQDAFLWLHAEKFWERAFVFPWNTVAWTVQNILDNKWHWENNIADLTLTAVALLATLICIRKLPFAYSAYALVMLIVPLTSYAIRDDFWASMPMAAAGRRAMVVFPAFIALGSTLRWRWLQALWSMTSLIAQSIMFIEFAKWIWVD